MTTTSSQACCSVPLLQLLRFLASWNAGVMIFHPMLFSGPGPDNSQKLSSGGPGPASNAWFLGLITISPQTVSRSVKPFSQGSQTWPTDRHTDIATTTEMKFAVKSDFSNASGVNISKVGISSFGPHPIGGSYSVSPDSLAGSHEAALRRCGKAAAKEWGERKGRGEGGRGTFKDCTPQCFGCIDGSV